MSKARDHIPAPFRVHVNGGTPVDLDPVHLSEQGIRLDHVRGNQYVLHSGGKTTPLVIEAEDRKNIKLSARNQTFAAVVLDHREQLLTQLGWDEAEAGLPSELISPMPGLVISISVEVGDVVSSGASLLILEAMKMENEIKSPSNCVIAAIRIQPGDAVQKGQVLLEFGQVAS